jgi:acyl-coenzyme A thioesterase PaaI-like protein
MRWGFNWFPAYRATGARLTYVSDDWREVHVRLPLNRQTRNYVGTIFGGSMYGAIDPVYMVMLIKVLGPEYIVWDKAATINFKRPGRGTLYAKFKLSEEDLAEIRRGVTEHGKMEWRTVVNLVDGAGEIHVSCDKVLSIRGREAKRPVTGGG